jgi:hypothetical protein
MIKQVTLAVAFALISFAAAFAETPEERQACTDDAFRVCQQAIPDRDRVFACLVANHTALSPLCRRALEPYVAAQTPSRPTTKSKSKAGKKVTNGPVNLSPSP